MQNERRLSFIAGCLAESALVVIAVFWGWLFRCPVFAGLNWQPRDALLGCLAAIPPLAFFVWTLRSRARVFATHRHLLEHVLRPLFGPWSIFQLAIISILAGFGEEALFRGAIQRSLAHPLGTILALVLTSVLFGCVHLLTYAYALIAAFIGAYLGLLWIWTGNLLTPMITHAVHDFLALVYFLRFYRRTEGPLEPR